MRPIALIAWRLVLWLTLAACSCRAATEEEVAAAQPAPRDIPLSIPPPTLLQAAQVRALSPGDAARSYPVRLRGTITYSDLNNWFFQDNSAGIYVQPIGSYLDWPAGTLVEITGFSHPGGFAPMVTNTLARNLGWAPLPPPTPRTISELMSGRYDSQWIEVEGVARDARVDGRALFIDLHADGSRLEVIIPGFEGQSAPTNLTDARLRVRGVCGTDATAKRQRNGLRLFTSKLADAAIIEPAPQNPFAAPLRPLGSLLQFDPRGGLDHRIHAQATVTCLGPHPRSFYVQEGTEGVWVRLLEESEAAVGDWVDLAGFVTLGGTCPTLTETYCRRLGPGRQIEPIATTVDEAMRMPSAYDAQLIRLDARLAGWLRNTDAHVLLLQAGEWNFTAVLDRALDARQLKALRPGSQLRLTGVCSTSADGDQAGATLHLHLRAQEDARVLHRPSWWTSERLYQAMGLGATTLAATLLWSVLLQRRVRLQTEVIQLKAEREVALEARLRDLFNQSTDILFTLDLDGNLTSLNPAGLAKLGVTPELLRQRGLPAFLTEEQIERTRLLTRQKLELGGQTAYDLEALTPDGRRVSLEVKSWRMEQNGRPLGIQGIARDISERKQAEQLLREREEYFRLLIENALDLICIVREDGVLTFMSPSSERILGYPSQAMLGRNSFEYVHPEDIPRVREALQRAARRESPPRTEVLRCRHASGQWLVMEGGGRLLSTDPQQRRQFVLNLHDITRQRRVEEQLRQAQKMEAVGQLAGGVAHDFNNILAAILMHLGLLQSEAQVPPEVAAALKEIEHEANRAATLVRQLLLFSRRQVMQIHPVEINLVVENLLKMLRRLLGENIVLDFQGAPGLPPVEADTGMLEQVVVNLSVNARDAMPKGGRLTIQTQLVEIQAETAASGEARTGSFIRLTVADDGCGMDELTLKRMFEPFFTTKGVGKGTGLGLATVYGIVKQHQGWTEVSSALGEGATFRVYLPAAPAALAASPVKALDPQPVMASQSPVSAHETILLVEDEDSVRRIVGVCLRRDGYAVLEAANGAEALDMWRRHRAAIDLLFTDVVLPEGMSGVELAEVLRSDKPALKVIISSGYNLEETPPSGGAANRRTVFISKPFRMSTVAKEVRQCLDEGRPKPLPPRHAGVRDVAG